MILNKRQGFTLIEAMVTVGIVAILAAIAAPAYLSQQRKGHRGEIINALGRISIEMNRCYADRGGYTACDDALILPKVLDITDSNDNTAPGYDTDQGHYSITITATDPDVGLIGDKVHQGFLITATPQGDQAYDTTCASFTIDHQGTRGGTNATCWSDQ